MRADDERSWGGGHPVAVLVAALGLTWAVQRRSGFYEPTSLHILILAMFAAAWAVAGAHLKPSLARLLPAWLRARLPASTTSSLFLIVALAGLAGELYALLTSSPGFAPVSRYPPLGLFRLGVAAGGGLAVLALANRPLLGRLHMPLVIAAHALVGIWMIHAVPEPSIDVWHFHKEGIGALLGGHSPYSSTIPNVYANSGAGYYGRGLVVADRVLAGYPYPPLSLLVALPGYALGDYRYALIAAVAIAAALLVAVRPDREGRAAAALLLFMPRVFFIYEQGWIEPFVVLMAAATAYCAVRRPKLLPFALAGLIAIKQYALLAVPLLPLLLPPGRSHNGAREGVRRVVPVALGLAAAFTLPFLIWDPKGFVHSVVTLQMRQPFRPESLSLLRDISGSLHFAPTSALSLVALLLALLVSLRLAPRTAYGFLASLAFVLLAMFGFAKQAFANYYFGVIGILLCAAVTDRDDRIDPREVRGPKLLNLTSNIGHRI